MKKFSLSLMKEHLTRNEMRTMVVAVAAVIAIAKIQVDHIKLPDAIQVNVLIGVCMKHGYVQDNNPKKFNRERTFSFSVV